MRNFFNRLAYSMNRFMQGRYGQDEMSSTFSKIGLILIIISVFPHCYMAYPFGLVLLLWSVFRSFSRNIYKRQREREKYLKITKKPRDFFSITRKKFKDRKTHDYYKCPNCGTYNRIPKGHGRIVITCPKCRTSFERGK